MREADAAERTQKMVRLLPLARRKAYINGYVRISPISRRGRNRTGGGAKSKEQAIKQNRNHRRRSSRQQSKCPVSVIYPSLCMFSLSFFPCVFLARASENHAAAYDRIPAGCCCCLMLLPSPLPEALMCGANDGVVATAAPNGRAPLGGNPCWCC